MRAFRVLVLSGVPSTAMSYFYLLIYLFIYLFCVLFKDGCPNIIRVIKSRTMRWEGHVACMGEKTMHSQGFCAET